MDNLTHALVGVAMAELAVRSPATRETRRVFMVTGVAAASAPDIDLIYTGLIEAPLGYLLHHRGHSHTLPGLMVLGLLIVLLCRLWPDARRVITADRVRFNWLLGTALVSHLLLDAANSYGTHLLYPLTSRWYYGDAVFILEPWVWLPLGVVAALNARRRVLRHVLWGLTAVPPAGLVWFGLLQPPLLLALVLAGCLAVAILRTWTSRVRAAAALAAVLLVFAACGLLSIVAKDRAGEALAALTSHRIVDIVSNPNPAAPWCWAVITLEADDEDEILVARRGTVSLLPSLQRAGHCASHQLITGARAGSPGQALVWDRDWVIDARGLREIPATDCRAAAWLQFGRVPYIDDGRLVDLRFDNPLGGNFSAIAIGGGRRSDCPSNLTDWVAPRADVLEP